MDPREPPDPADDVLISRGRCLCGAVAFEARGSALWTAYCHCRSCRRQTGSPVTLYSGFDSQQVRFSGAEPGTFASSPGTERGFCRHCGTPIYYRSTRWPGETHLFTCTFDAPEAFPPQSHVYFAEHLPGFDVRDGLPRKS
ncbi:MAG: GFA family protein [Pseudomonadales bacterium]